MFGLSLLFRCIRPLGMPTRSWPLNCTTIFITAVYISLLKTAMCKWDEPRWDWTQLQRGCAWCVEANPLSHRSLTYSHQLRTLPTLSLTLLSNAEPEPVNSICGTAAVDTCLGKGITNNEATLSTERNKNDIKHADRYDFNNLVSAHFQGRISVLLGSAFHYQHCCRLWFCIVQETTLMHDAEKKKKKRQILCNYLSPHWYFYWYLYLWLVSNCAHREDDKSSCPNVAKSSLWSPVGLHLTEVNYWAHKYVNNGE